MDIDKIEQQRRQLDAQVSSLRDSLKHWQLWDAEYEGLKEEIQLKKDQNISQKALAELSVSYSGNLVNEKEVRDIVGLSSGSPRSRQQILNLIDHRLVYVSKNIETISRQYYAAEGKLEEFDFAAVVAAGDDARFGHLDDTHAAPLVEIHEELDDDGNVITSELRQPDVETQKMLDKITNKQQSASTNSKSNSTAQTSHPLEPSNRTTRRPPIRKKSVSFSADTKAAEKRESSEAPDGRKSVSFAAKVAIAPAAAPPDNRSVSFATSVEEIPVSEQPPTPIAQNDGPNLVLQDQLRSSFKPGETVYELNEDEQPARRHIVLPENESAEDANMRRLMLNYHLNEVGSVMADMDAEEGDGYGDDHSDFTSSENLDELDTPYTTGTSDDEDEDEFGRSRGSGISDQYRLQMSALSARLMHNDELKPSSTSPLEAPASTIDLPIRSGRSSMSSADSVNADYKERPNNKKRVSFAEVLDVATEFDPPTKVQKATLSSPHPAKFVNALSSSAADDYDEDDDDAAAAGSERVTGPVISDTLVERTAKDHKPLAPADDDPDLLMSRRELASEYYRQRNNMMREQGGFSNEHNAEQDGNQLYEERDGKARKVSRFKAARLRN